MIVARLLESCHVSGEVLKFLAVTNMNVARPARNVARWQTSINTGHEFSHSTLSETLPNFP
jgi:hypothetical protein